MPENYNDYKDHVIDDIETCIDSLGCQPILFVGSGLSRRYMSAPNWEELLKKMVDICPNLDKSYPYYKQSHKDPIAIGSIFVEPFKEWAWSVKEEVFPADLFTADYNSDIYLKYQVSKYFDKITPENFSEIASTPELSEEINALRAINPHAIITTNYDKLLEVIFEDYKPVIGQQILRYNTFSIGEIFKIHGCTTDYNSLVLTQNDYDYFSTKKKYLSAKLLTFFAEHPLIFIGYSASDPNIKTILSDIDEILSEESELIPNIYILQWKNNISDSEYPQREHNIPLNDNRNIRVKCIVTTEFDWVFKAFSNNKPIESMHPKILRALLARTYDLVRCDIPRKTVEVDFETLEHAVANSGGLGKIYGFTTIGDATLVNAQFPFSLTQVAEKLGFSSWHSANQLLDKVKRETGTDIKATDNKYHISIKAGEVMITQKYSQETVDLLQNVKNNKKYEINV